MKTKMISRARYSAAFRFQLSTTVMTATIAMALWFGAGMFVPSAHAATGDADDQAMVDCMLPGRIQRLNNNVTIMGARHPIRTTPADCHVRGGEYHAVDRSAEIARAAEADRIAEADRMAKASRIAKPHRATRAHRIAKPHRTAKTIQSMPTK